MQIWFLKQIHKQDVYSRARWGSTPVEGNRKEQKEQRRNWAIIHPQQWLRLPSWVALEQESCPHLEQEDCSSPQPTSTHHWRWAVLENVEWPWRRQLFKGGQSPEGAESCQLRGLPTTEGIRLGNTSQRLLQMPAQPTGARIKAWTEEGPRGRKWGVRIALTWRMEKPSPDWILQCWRDRAVMESLNSSNTYRKERRLGR